MAKPMLVTLPFVLLLLDYWPLNRTKGNLKKIIIEKLPFFVLSLASCIITFIAQKSSGSVAAFHRLPFEERLVNAIVSYAAYIQKTFWPTKLAVLYP